MYHSLLKMESDFLYLQINLSVCNIVCTDKFKNRMSINILILNFLFFSLSLLYHTGENIKDVLQMLQVYFL